ncbi:hypothetical protein GIW41_29380 [Pseudomonas sp. PA-6-1D]|uniref:Uncharacterized protein n=1 Tax=Pseudomonas edaphica TaxID=2006980 RepID=A0A7Y8FJW2_9PSED|nr:MULTISPECIES: hypothetical protein [Pseudomonas]MCF5143292.1 hypothetical protein [Pseudomonas sp. PA-6-3C]MCF5148714.1 hypothetical protein [Pseudomonas sp. PA-6-3F]MCF5161581.1 hypothetical protein [Pseudomonas sp. PA-6-2E]MCF5179354.1 hypothetical protein [Pseudomonas sp. PA-6-1D]MCF5194236.1 hypothetical protein [Pseudomonas sp. PA-6-1H]
MGLCEILYVRAWWVVERVIEVRSRLYVVLLLAALLNGFLRFDGSWKRFFLMVLVQLWFGQAVYSYARGARVAIAPGGMSKDADPEWRAALAGFALFLYGVVFFLSF